MRRASLRTATATLVAVVLVVPVSWVPVSWVPASSAAGTVSPRDVGDRISAVGDDLAAANKAVARAAKALEAARTALPGARARLAAANSALVKAKAASAAAASAQALAASRSAIATKKLGAAQARIVETNDQIGDLVRAVYTQGPYTELAAILNATTPSDFAAGLEAVRAVSRSQNRALADLEAAKAALALAEAQAQAAQARADAARTTAASALAAAATLASGARAAQAHVASLVAARASALSVAAKNKASVKRQYDALKAEQARLRELARRPRAGYTGRPTGTLDWPIPGAAIVGGVGWRVHPVYGYKSCHTGMDIRGGNGTPILAPAPGRVIEVLSGGAYGLHTLVDHGGGLVTMYAHQSRTAVHVGQIVARGQVLGYVGSSGWVTGPHLHWEVHVDGVPYDPLGWFGGARVPVPCWNG